LKPQDFAHEILQDSREFCGNLVISLILGGHFTRGDLQKHKLSEFARRLRHLIKNTLRKTKIKGCDETGT
jgi:hypothetical protein